MNKITTFYLVRHGQTDWNKNRILQGHKDTTLNETGEQQAKELAEVLKDVNFDLAFSSDLLRAKRTADIIALEKKLHVATTKALRERNFAHLEGGTSDVFNEYLTKMKGLSHDERLKHKMAEGIETDEEMTTRLITFLRETAVSNPDKKVLVTSHSGILRLFLIHTGTYSYDELDNIKMKNGSYIIFECDGVNFFVKDIVGIEERKGLQESV